MQGAVTANFHLADQVLRQPVSGAAALPANDLGVWHVNCKHFSQRLLLSFKPRLCRVLRFMKVSQHLQEQSPNSYFLMKCMLNFRMCSARSEWRVRGCGGASGTCFSVGLPNLSTSPTLVSCSATPQCPTFPPGTKVSLAQLMPVSFCQGRRLQA